MNIEWLNNLKIGDPVIQSSWVGGMKGDHLFPTSVVRMTKTQIIVASGEKYSKKNGDRIGDHYSNNRIIKATPENMRRAIREKYIRDIKRVDWDKLDIDVLERINKFVTHKSV